MTQRSALLTFSIGPVHTFISQARRLADLWAGSQILSELIGMAIETLADPARPNDRYWQIVFPAIPASGPPPGLPNRFVCRVPFADAASTASQMKEAVRGRWKELVEGALNVLTPLGLVTDGQGDSDETIQVAWSCVQEDGDYPDDSRRSAEVFASSRLFRPFIQREDHGEKCAVCGERTALPDGDREKVHGAWRAAEGKTKGGQLEAYFRAKQGRLCLVCATKRLYPHVTDKRAHFDAFDAFDAFHPDDDTSYVAVVSMDGDNLGTILGWPAKRIAGRDVEAFQRGLSRVLSSFAADLRGNRPPNLNLACLQSELGNRVLSSNPPQLIYAGGEDVLFVSDVRDAIPLAGAIRKKYQQVCQTGMEGILANPADSAKFTISAGVLFAHTKQPAGLMFRDVDHLLNDVAKTGEGRDAIAVRLAKRGGVPVEMAFKWDGGGDKPFIDLIAEIAAAVRGRDLSSGQIFRLMDDARILYEVMGNSNEEWRQWIEDRLSRREGSSGQTKKLAELIAPLLGANKPGVLRIARFLGGEAES